MKTICIKTNSMIVRAKGKAVVSRSFFQNVAEFSFQIRGWGKTNNLSLICFGIIVMKYRLPNYIGIFLLADGEIILKGVLYGTVSI